MGKKGIACPWNERECPCHPRFNLGNKVVGCEELEIKLEKLAVAPPGANATEAAVSPLSQAAACPPECCKSKP